MQYYTLKVAGLTRQLPLCAVSDTLDIAAFVMFSDVEMTVACAKELAKKIPECDVLITAETKGIPLAYEMSRQTGIPYIVARKSVKVYTRNPIEVTVNSITTQHTQKLYLGQDEVDMMKSKRIVVVDDVISTGESLLAIERLVEKAGGNIVAKAGDRQADTDEDSQAIMEQPDDSYYDYSYDYDSGGSGYDSSGGSGSGGSGWTGGAGGSGGSDGSGSSG